MKSILIVFIMIVQYGCANSTYYYNNNKKVNLTPSNIQERSINNSKVDYYINDNGIVLGVSDKLMLKLKSDGNIDNYLSEFDLVLLREIRNNLYYLQTRSKEETINIANALSLKEDVSFCHPDFLKKMIQR